MTEDEKKVENRSIVDTYQSSEYLRFAPLNRKLQERVIHDEKYSDGVSDELSFIHIGKCGGYTVSDALAVSPVILQNFKSVKRIHIRRPYYQKNAQYLFILRNPIDRLISAFTWRYHKVVVTKEQELKFTGEYEVLCNYKTLNNLAEALIIDGKVSISALKDLALITHFRQDIAFYLDPIIPQLKTHQVFSIFIQEELETDITSVLKTDTDSFINHSNRGLFEENSQLSELAVNNLMVVFQRDYECIKILNDIYPIGFSRMNKLLERS